MKLNAFRLMPVSLALFIPVASSSGATPDEAAVLEGLQQAATLFAEGALEAFVAKGERAVELSRQGFEASDPVRIKAALTLSGILMQAGRMEEAAPLAEEAYEGAEAALAAARSRVADTLKFLGTLRSVSGDLEGASEIFERAVELSTETHGADSPETAKHLGNLGMSAYQLGQVERARDVLSRTIEVWEAQKEPHPAYYGGAMLNLAVIETEAGNYDAAFELCHDAVALHETSYGESDPRLANTLRRYATMLRAAGREDEASTVEERLERLGAGR